MPLSVSPAVKIYMDQFKLQPNAGRKQDIDLTVQDLTLWTFVCSHWGYWSKGKWVKFNPLAVGHLLSEYERLEGDRPAQKIAGYLK